MPNFVVIGYTVAENIAIFHAFLVECKNSLDDRA